MTRIPLYAAALLVPLGALLLIRSREAGAPARMDDVAGKLAQANQARARGDRAADLRLRGAATRALGGLLREEVDRRNAGALLILAGIVSAALFRWGTTGAALAVAAVAVVALAFLMLGPLRGYERLRGGADSDALVFVEDELRAVRMREASLPLLAATLGGVVAVALSRSGEPPAAAGRARAALALGALCLGAAGLVWVLYGDGILREVP